MFLFNHLFSGRRKFLKSSVVAISGLPIFPLSELMTENKEGLHIIGPKEGFSPQIGTLVSMMNWMRSVVLRSVANLKTDELDFVFDKNANSIGAMLLHLAATEAFYQANTFEGRKDYNEEEKKEWGIAMNLGDEGRKAIRGNDLQFYLSVLERVRNKTISEFKKRDDKWLAKTEPFFGGQPTNNYCKWFHVCEHESNHNGQIKWLKSRLPNADPGKD